MSTHQPHGVCLKKNICMLIYTYIYTYIFTYTDIYTHIS